MIRMAVIYFLAGLGLVPRVAAALDVYLVSVNATVTGLPPRNGAGWVTGPIFFNTSDQPVTARLIGLSNGAVPQDSSEATFPAGSLRNLPTSWYPMDPGPSLYVTHIDVASDLLISNRLFYYLYLNCGFPACGPGNSGGIQLPVFRSLAPPGTRQVLLDADMGESMSVRSNVTVYNAGESPAHATIEVHVGCDGSTVGTQTVVVSPNTIIQVQAFSVVGAEEACDPFDPEHAPVGSRYVTVVMDEPGFSLLSVLKNGTFDYTIPIGISAGVPIP